MNIHFILTCGTIDSYYDGTKDTAVPQVHSVLPRYIKGLNLPYTFKFTEVCMKDSRAMMPSNIKKIVQVIKHSTAKKIIITHGTYTMSDSARYVERHFKDTKKTIVFTGSMIPLDGFNFSDAGFNLGFALAQVNSLTPGTYVVMNGKVLLSENATKIISEGRFTSLFTSKQL